jgi:hypothetical protein
LKKDARILDRISQALAADAHLSLSPVVFYEIKRGLVTWGLNSATNSQAP